MSSLIVDYASLQTAITDTLSDDTLSAYTDRMIQLAEAMFNRRLENLEMEETVEAPATQTMSLPDGFNRVRSIYINTNPIQKLEYMTPDDLRTFYPDGSSGLPQNYTIIANELELAPPPDSDYTVVMTCEVNLPALSLTNTTNWLLLAHPDLYLYGSLMHAEFFGWNDDRLPLLKSAVDGLIAEINGAGIQKRFGGSMRMRPPVVEQL